nr:hypothetical protein [Tanacetum cinerariifolium]
SNVETVEYKSIRFIVWDVGGQNKGLIFVVDGMTWIELFRQGMNCIGCEMRLRAILVDVNLRVKFAKKISRFKQISEIQVSRERSTEGRVKTQALETVLSQLKAQLASAHIQLNSYNAENKTLSQRYEELAKSNMASRVQLSGRITALTTENATLKARVTGKQNSGSKSLAKPKVTTTGMVSGCPTRNERLSFGNRDSYVVQNWKTVNRKTTTIKQVFQPMKQVVTLVKKVWKATGKDMFVILAGYTDCPMIFLVAGCSHHDDVCSYQFRPRSSNNKKSNTGHCLRGRISSTNSFAGQKDALLLILLRTDWNDLSLPPYLNGPAPNFLTPRQISSGLVPSPVPATPYAPLTNKELEILFQPMFDEYLDHPRADRSGSPAQAV